MVTQTDFAIDRALKAYPKAKRIAVDNFVSTAPDNKVANHYNIDLDTALYGWNQDTKMAIMQALRELGKL